MNTGLLAVALLTGLLAGVLVRSTLLSQAEPPETKQEAADYVREGSFTVTKRNELYLYRELHKQPAVQNPPPDGNESGAEQNA